jgi:hypothetical protein
MFIRERLLFLMGNEKYPFIERLSRGDVTIFASLSK